MERGEKLLTTTDVARILNRSSESVRQYARCGKLHVTAQAQNGLRLYREVDVLALAKKLTPRLP